MKVKTKILLFVGSIFILALNWNFSAAQNDPVKHVDSVNGRFLNWHNLDPETDGIMGAAVERVYQENLANVTGQKKVIVAVIDGGIDIHHKDLNGKIWTNLDEIPENGLDDDSNGYIDDIYGWNFIGNAEGENIQYETLEYTRILKNLNAKYEQIRSIHEVGESEREEYLTYLACKNEFDEELKKHQTMKNNIDAFEKYLNYCEGKVKQFLQKDSIVSEDLYSLTTANEEVMNARNFLLKKYEQGFTYSSFYKMKEHNQDYLFKHLNMEFNPRVIIADNPDDINDSNYGNNDVVGPRAEHGTFVAGLIAANRNDGYGINGIAENVEIMVLRVVPKGDERDKDVALAIRYAVDNGAKIINMSFGKNFSPQKHFVDEAIQYADSRNVLMVHAAGNDAVNVDETDRFPTNYYNNDQKANNWITVGASSMELSEELCGVFSNYGQEKVDLFAPGVDVVSLFPENQFQVSNGTSFASPVVAGVAALVWSKHPELTASEVKDILMQSASSYPKHKVYIPNLESKKKKKTKFYKLSKTGGIVNAYNAMNLAKQYADQKMVQVP